MKNDEKCKNEVVWGLGIPQGHQQHNHSIERIHLLIQLLIQTMHVYLVPFSSYSKLFAENG